MRQLTVRYTMIPPNEEIMTSKQPGSTGPSGAGGAEALAAALRALHVAAGKPSTRKMATEIGNISHTTVADVLKGSRVPSWRITEDVCRYLGGDVEEIRILWNIAASGHKSETSVIDAHDVELTRIYRQFAAEFYKPPGSTRRTFSGLFRPVQANIVEIVGRERPSVALSRSATSQLGITTPRAIVYGNAGSGKTTLCMSLMHHHATHGSTIPFLVKLGDFALNGLVRESVPDHIRSSIGALFQTNLSDAQMSSILRSGNALVAFDGLNDVEPDAMHRVVATLNFFCATYPECGVIVTSRAEAASESFNLTGFRRFLLTPNTGDAGSSTSFRSSEWPVEVTLSLPSADNGEDFYLSVTFRVYATNIELFLREEIDIQSMIRAQLQAHKRLYTICRSIHLADFADARRQVSAQISALTGIKISSLLPNFSIELVSADISIAQAMQELTDRENSEGGRILRDLRSARLSARALESDSTLSRLMIEREMAAFHRLESDEVDQQDADRRRLEQNIRILREMTARGHLDLVAIDIDRILNELLPQTSAAPMDEEPNNESGPTIEDCD